MKKTLYENIGESVYSETLHNGLTVYVLPKPGFVKGFALFATHYGGAMRRFELDGKTLDTPAGVAHFLEHKMFDMPDGRNALAELSATGASPNAFTGYDMTAYYFRSSGELAANLRSLLDFVSTPHFTAESVSKEQGIIGQEIRMTEDSPGFSVYVNLMRCLYRESPLRESVAGTVESIAEITEETLYNCYNAFYRPRNMVLCVVGDIEPDEVCAIAREMTPSDMGEAPRPDFGADEGVLPYETYMSVPMAVSAPQFMIGAKLAPAPAGEAALRQRLVGDVALRVLTGRSSPFYNTLYEKGLLKNDFSAALTFAGGGAVIMAAGESAEPKAVLEELIARASGMSMDKEAFERAKRALYGDLLRSLESFDSACIEAAEGYFAGYLAADAFAMLETVTAEECAAFISENLGRERLALSEITPVKG